MNVRNPKHATPDNGLISETASTDTLNLGTVKSLELAKQVLSIEAQAIEALIPRLDENFQRAIDVVLGCNSRVVVCGMGKSGHIARKIASTLASTGTPAFFIHPAEALHGDLGMITGEDVLIALSHSGETSEVLAILPLLKRKNAKVIALTGNLASTLASEADICLDASVAVEACPLGLAPTASTTAALALGDALAIALLDARGFGEEDFARTHPGGALGRRLLLHVRDLMQSGDKLPKVADSSLLTDALMEMSRKGLGMTAVVDTKDQLIGIFTDGDLRRALDKPLDMRTVKVGQIMTRNPRTVQADQLAVEAVQLMEQFKITALLVLDKDQNLVGALNMHALLKAGVV